MDRIALLVLGQDLPVEQKIEAIEFLISLLLYGNEAVQRQILSNLKEDKSLQ